MASMSVNQIILDAFYFLGEWSPNRAPEGDMMTEAERWLNILLAEWRAESFMIPFLKTISFVATAGKGEYTIGPSPLFDINHPKIVDLMYAEFNLSGVAYSLSVVQPDVFLDASRLISLQSLPGICYLLQATDHSIFTVYPQPSSNYEFKLRVKTILDDVSLNEEVVELPMEYASVLRLGLAEKISCLYETSNWTHERSMQLAQLKENIKSRSYKDLWIKTKLGLGLQAGYKVRAGI